MNTKQQECARRAWSRAGIAIAAVVGAALRFLG